MNLLKSKIRLWTGISLILFSIVASSCSTPAWQKSKYRKGKRFQDCGCMYSPTPIDSPLCLNEQK